MVKLAVFAVPIGLLLPGGDLKGTTIKVNGEQLGAEKAVVSL